MERYSNELLGDCDLQLRCISNITEISNKFRHCSKLYLCFALCFSLLCFCGIFYFLFDYIVKRIITSHLVLSPDSDIIKIWQDPKINTYIKVYFFNLTNAEEFAHGQAAPNLQEVGPYVYSQNWTKVNLVWYPNGSISYQNRRTFTFIPSLSNGDEVMDRIISINVPAVSAYHQMKSANFISRLALNTVLNSLDYKIWLSSSPRGLLWGYDEPLFDLARIATLAASPPFNKFGYFYAKTFRENETFYTIDSGNYSISLRSSISHFNGNKYLDVWGGFNKCGFIQGSDGSTFHPYIEQNDTLWFFNKELCHSIPLVFDRVVHRSFDVFRFVPRQDVFKVPKDVPPSENCFCQKEPNLCHFFNEGFLDVSLCQYNAPIVLSWPHFLKGGNLSRFNSKLVGLSVPYVANHGFWFDIEPTTGTTVGAKVRLQINVVVLKNKQYEILSKINDSIIPSLWLEEGIDDIGSNINTMIELAVKKPPIYKRWLLFILYGLMVFCICLSLVVFQRIWSNNYSINTNSVRAPFRLKNRKIQNGISSREFRSILFSSGSSTVTHSRNSFDDISSIHQTNT